MSTLSPIPKPPRNRLIAIDFARGVFVLIIIAAHATHNLRPDALPRSVQLILDYALSGTVGFTTISGLLIGYFVVVKANDLSRVYSRYRKQALRLLLVAHPLIAIALVGPKPSEDPWWEFCVRMIFITDVLALIFIFVVPFIDRLGSRNCVVLGASLIILSRMLWMVPVSDPVLLFFRDVLCDIGREKGFLLESYSVLSLTGYFLIGSYFGQKVAAADRVGNLHQLGYKFRLTVLPLSGLSLVLIGLWAASRYGLPNPWGGVLSRFFYPSYSLTLYPGYLGATLFVLGVAISVGRVRFVGPFFCTLGKASLFVYVLQYFVIETLPWYLGWDANLDLGAFSAFFVCAVTVIWALATLWNAYVKGHRSK